MTTYSWQVRAVNTAGITYADGAASAVWNFKTRIAPPTNFLKLTPTTNSTGQSLTPVLTWSPSTGTDLHYEYCIYGPLLTGNACNTWVTTTATTAAIDGLNYETTSPGRCRLSTPAGTTYANGTANNYSTFTTLIAKPYLLTNSALSLIA